MEGLRMKQSIFVIFGVISLGFLLVPLTLTEPAVASPVTLFEPTEIESTSLVLQWEAHPYEEPDPDGEGICYLYRVEVHMSTVPDFTPNSSTHFASSYGTRVKVYGLDQSTTYYFKVVVLHKSGYGEEPPCSLQGQPSNEVSATTLPSAVRIRTMAVNPDRPWDSVDISWNANADKTGFEMYAVERAFAANFSDAVVAGTSSNQATERYTVTSLAPSTAYFFRVTVHATTGKMNSSPPEAAMTEDVPEATAVTLNSPSGSDIAEESVRLSWGPVRDEFCDRYVIERARTSDFTDSTSVTIEDCNATEYIWKGLKAGTTYYFRVVSHNAAGNETPSNTVRVLTRSRSMSMTEVLTVANTIVLLVILLLLLTSFLGKRSKTGKQE